MSDDEKQPRTRFSFDPTVNLGHVLTFLSFIAVGAAGYSSIDKRISLLEEKAEVALRLAETRVVEQKETLREIRTDIKEVSRGMGDLERALRQEPRQQRNDKQ